MQKLETPNLVVMVNYNRTGNKKCPFTTSATVSMMGENFAWGQLGGKYSQTQVAQELRKNPQKFLVDETCAAFNLARALGKV